MFDKVEVYDTDGNLVAVEDNRTLESAKAGANKFINDNRTTLLDRGMWFIGHFWDTSDIARSNINGAISLVLVGVSLPPGFVWRDNNNINVPFNSTMLVGLGATMVGYVNQIYAYSWYLKTLVDAVTTLEDFDALDLVSGWPDGNMDGTMPLYYYNTYLADGAVGNSYTQALNIHGGHTPYTLSVTSGSLPDGLSISNTSIVGTPTTSGTSTFELTATDSTANTALTNATTFTLNIA